MVPPKVDLLLVEYLEETFPDRCPLGDERMREVWMAAGKAYVIRHLRDLVSHQEADPFPDE